MLAAPAAEAHRLHTVGPGDTLWWIAAQNDLTTRAVAVYNGLAPDANVVLGGTIDIPTEAEAAAALAAGAGTTRAGAGSAARARRAAPAAAPATILATSPAARHSPATPASCAPATRSARSPRRAPSASSGRRRPGPRGARIVPVASPMATPGILSAERVKQLAA